MVDTLKRTHRFEIKSLYKQLVHGHYEHYSDDHDDYDATLVIMMMAQTNKR